MTAIEAGELGYANQVGKIQYPEESIYEFREGTFNSYFATVYRNQQNLQVILEQAEAEGATNMEAAAKTWSAYIWLLATDMWRDIPFTDALGAAALGGCWWPLEIVPSTFKTVALFTRNNFV